MKVQKIQKNDEKRRFMRSKVKVQKIRKNDEKRLSGGGEVQNKKSEKMMRKDVSPISALSIISDSKRQFKIQLKKFFFYRRLCPLAHLGPFFYFSYDGKMMRKDVSGGQR
jgi:hypothetical protein